METETWKDVEGCEGAYQVSNWGRVRSLDREVPHSSGGLARLRGRILKPQRGGAGYLHVTLRGDGEWSHVDIHRLVLDAFMGPAPDGHECNHIDGDKANNHIDNLEWVTHGANMRHAFRSGLHPSKGEAHHCARLTVPEVERIRQLYAGGEHTQAQIGVMFGVAQTTVSQIVRGKCWATA